MTRWNRFANFAKILLLVWVVGVVSYYYVNHKPFTPSLGLGWAEGAWKLFIGWGVVSLAGGIGAVFRIGQRTTPAVQMTLQVASGVGILGGFILALGMTVGINGLVSWIFFLSLSMALRKYVLHWWQTLAKVVQKRWAGSGLIRTIWIGIVFIALVTLVDALAPPTRFDSLVYHLELPRAYLAAGKINYLPDNMYWGMPQTAEMLYLLGMGLSGAQVGGIVSWMLGMLVVLGLAGYVGEQFGAQPAAIAAASLMSGFTLASSLSWGYVGWTLMLFGLAFLIALQQGQFTIRWADAIAAGVFSGLALGTKYTGGLLLLIGIVVIVYISFRRKSIAWKSLLVFLIFSLLVPLPWWYKNWVATGNPFYPFLFPSGAMDDVRLFLYQGHAPWGHWMEALFLPWRATMQGVEGAPGFAASIGPLFLALGGLFWIGWGKRPEIERKNITMAALVSLLGLVIWATASRISGLLIQARLYLAVFPAFGYLVGAGFAKVGPLRWLTVRIGHLITVFVTLVLWLNALEVGVESLQRGAPQLLFGLQSSEEFLDQNLGWFSPAMTAIQDLSEADRVLMLWEPRSLYCAPICIPDEILDRWLHDMITYPDVDRVVDSWRGAGITHLLYYRIGADFTRQGDQRYQPSDWEALDALLASLPTVAKFGHAYELYELIP